MKTGVLRALIPAALIAVCGIISAGAQETGTIAGKVKDIRTGQYLENARVTLDATGQKTLTDSFGQFRIQNVPTGTADITVFFTGYYSSTQTIEVNSNIAANVQIDLRSRSAFESEDEIYELDAFVVKSQYDAQAAAINEQRFAAGNKAVIDAEALGNINEGNIGEFVKFLPGISINYVAADVRSIEVRGMGDKFTPVTIDGNQMASASSSNMNRTFELEQVSLNNVERVEVVKIPTPDMPANSLGGSVNLVSKSAFERDGREIRYNAYLSGNNESLSLGKEVGPGNAEKYHILPGVKLTYADVYNDGNLGIIVNYLASNQWNPQHRSAFTWHFDDMADGTSDQPTLERYTLQDGPKLNYRQSFNIKLDYKLSENTILLTSAQWNAYESRFRNTNVTWDTNVTKQSENASSSTSVIRSNADDADINFGGSWRDKFGDTYHGDAKIIHTMGDLELEVAGFWSRATNKYRSVTRNFLEAAELSYQEVDGYIEISDFGGNNDLSTTVDLKHIDGSGTNNPGLGTSDPSQFALTGVNAYRPKNGLDKVMGWNADAKWNFETSGGLSGYLKTGLKYTKQERETEDIRHRYYHTGPDGSRNSGDEITSENFINDAYAYNEQHFGIAPVIAWTDFGKWKDFYDNNANQFILRGIDGAGNKSIIEKVTAAYVMGSLNLMDNRLQVYGGMRFEKTDVSARGNSDDREVDSDYNTSHPSITARYDLTDKMVLRVAYAETIGRQNFDDLMPNVVVNYPDVTSENPEGRVEANNPGLKPQNADNFDISLEYYTDNAGMITAGYFYKKISNYIRDTSFVIDSNFIDQYGLPSETLGWEFRSNENAGTAEVNGFEVAIQQQLTFLPDALRGFSVFANGTFLDIEGDFGGVGIQSDLKGFVKETYNFGVSFERWGLTTNLKFTHKGEEFDGPNSSNDLGRFGDGGRYFDPLDQMDFDLEYQISRRYTVYLSARNLLNDSQDRVLKSASANIHVMERAEEFGVQYSLGVKGSF